MKYLTFAALFATGLALTPGLNADIWNELSASVEIAQASPPLFPGPLKGKGPSAVQNPPALPQTASPLPGFALAGLMLVCAALTIRFGLRRIG